MGTKNYLMKLIQDKYKASNLKHFATFKLPEKAEMHNSDG